MKVGGRVQVNMHRLTVKFLIMSYFEDGGHDVISFRQVLPPGEWIWSICRHLCSNIHQFM